ncbi:hypothetical protein L0244_36490 [bacterium]|nr:hypothetical protein [bacterium]
MFELKKISKDSITVALEKAERYRLLNEPRLTESICLDILEIDPQNNKAIVIMLLAITDQFDNVASADINQARQLLPRLSGDYERHYYGGIICERQGKAILAKDIPDGKFIVYEWLRDAMDHYEKAESIRPSGNDDAILRWNTCARLIMRHQLQPREERREERYVEQQLE